MREEIFLLKYTNPRCGVKTKSIHMEDMSPYGEGIDAEEETGGDEPEDEEEQDWY